MNRFSRNYIINVLPEVKFPNPKHQIIYPVKYIDYGYGSDSDEDYIVDLLHNFLQENLTGRVNHKFQYPMTKTLTSVVSHRFAHQRRTAIALGTTADGSLVWNFEFDFWDLFGI